MSIVIVCLYVVEVIVCLLLAMVVMLQKPKDGGLGGAIGGGMLEASLGADAGSVLIKTTTILGVIFLLNTLVLARLTSTVGDKSVVAEGVSVVEQSPVLPAADTAMPSPAPAATEAPALPATEAPALPEPEAPAK